MFVELKFCLFSALLTRIWAAQTRPNIVFILADDLVKCGGYYKKNFDLN